MIHLDELNGYSVSGNGAEFTRDWKIMDEALKLRRQNPRFTAEQALVEAQRLYSLQRYPLPAANPTQGDLFQ